MTELRKLPIEIEDFEEIPLSAYLEGEKLEDEKKNP